MPGEFSCIDPQLHVVRNPLPSVGETKAAQVLGAAMRYNVANLVGRGVGVAARIDKALLPGKQ